MKVSKGQQVKPSEYETVYNIVIREEEAEKLYSIWRLYPPQRWGAEVDEFLFAVFKAAGWEGEVENESDHETR